MSVAIQNEREFALKFLQLVGLSSDAKPEQFYSTSDYHKLSSLGPTLPKIQISLPKGKPSISKLSEKMIDVGFKSIKPPFKFSTQLSNVPVSHSVYRVKSDLIESLPLLKEANVKAANLKLLVKGKVIQDTSILSALVGDGQDLSFMCMVGQPTAEQEAAADPTDDHIDEVVSSVHTKELTVSEDTWQKIYNVLVDDLDSKDMANRALAKIKSAFE